MAEKDLVVSEDMFDSRGIDAGFDGEVDKGGLYLPDNVARQPEVVQDDVLSLPEKMGRYLTEAKERIVSFAKHPVSRGGVVVLIGLGAFTLGTATGTSAETLLGTATVGVGLKGIAENTIFKKQG